VRCESAAAAAVPASCSLVLHEMESTPKLMQSKPVVTSHGMTLRIIDQPSEDTATQSKLAASLTQDELIQESLNQGLCKKKLTRRVQCDHCMISDVKLRKCQGCDTVSYCSTDCQRAAWPTHKRACHLASKKKGLGEFAASVRDEVD
jgi:hypothetical protein